ncbi:MAG: S1 RNA-binding domain-containing protein [Clostridia bacterium]|nr:S1 RNA-binding domain-containing protein [Clostridia bacterium]
MTQYDRKIFDILRVINGRVNEGIQKMFEPLDITMPQAMILAAVHHKEAMRMTELAELMKTSCANCSTICQRLEKAGLLNRVRDEADRRVVNLELTDKSKEIILTIAEDLELNREYEGKVVRIMQFGAFVEVAPGKDGMIHISKLAKERVEKVEDVVNIGDKVLVKTINIDNKGRVDFKLIKKL